MVKTHTSRPIALDLFAGAGGLSLGLEQAGFDVVGAVELDPIHAAAHKANFPDASVLCQDIREVTGADLRRECGIGRRAVDLVAGGPPCQGFSLIGKRVLEDPRNSLVHHFMRIVQEIRPRTFVMENVPGMASGKHTQLLDELIGGFERSGYRVRLPYQLLNAAQFGVPQKRSRLFLIGARQGVRLPEYPDPTSSLPGAANGHAGLPACPTARDALGDLPDIELTNSKANGDDFRDWILKGGSSYARRIRGEEEDSDDYSYRRNSRRVGVTGCRAAKHTVLSRSRFKATTPGNTEPVSRFFKLAPDGVSNTLRAGTATDRGAYTAPRPIHYEHARCISVREAARLHSYPDWFRFHRTIWHGFRQIGNSVPPLLARAVGQAIRSALGVEPIKPSRTLEMGDESLTNITMKDAANLFGVSHHQIAPRQRQSQSGSGRV